MTHVDGIHEFLDMGGYAVWVWSAYGISAAGLIGILMWSLRTLRAREKEFEDLKNSRG